MAGSAWLCCARFSPMIHCSASAKSRRFALLFARTYFRKHSKASSSRATSNRHSGGGLDRAGLRCVAKNCDGRSVSGTNRELSGMTIVVVRVMVIVGVPARLVVALENSAHLSLQLFDAVLGLGDLRQLLGGEHGTNGQSGFHALFHQLLA
jgi:hypothetical protein